MKKHLFFLLTLSLMGAGSAFAQSEIVVGDMNDDGQLTVGDVTALTETILGNKDVRRLSVSGDPYAVDNASIVGKWMDVSGTITFNADGTTDYKPGYTYEYQPAQCLVVFYNASKEAVESLEVIKLDDSSLVLADASFTNFYTYGEHGSFADDGSSLFEDTNGHRYVDLGLPSGTLWATMNVGASAPEEYGDYYAWGEVEPKTTYTAGNYFDSVNGSSSNFKKYHNAGGATELELVDDAAYRNWGEGWRIPNSDQIEELFNSKYTTTEWATQNGKNGRLITSKSNGATIFLPAAGARFGDNLMSASYVGWYWSSSLGTLNSYNAEYLYFNENSIRGEYMERRVGRSVRPVRANAYAVNP